MTLKKDAETEIHRLKVALAQAQSKLELFGNNFWIRWEPYLCIALGVLVGVAIGHFA